MLPGAAVQVPMALSIVLLQSLRGAGSTREAFAIAVLGSFVMRISATLFFVRVLHLGLAGVWLGSGADWIVRAGDLAGAAAVAAEAEAALGPAAGQRIRSQVADQVWRWRGASAARPFYEALDASTLDDDEARTLIIKRAMVDRGGLRAEVFRDLLIGRGELDPSPTSAMARLGLDPLASNDPWAAYLAGRQLFLAERFVPALEALRVGDVATLGESRVLAEVQRMRAIAMYRNGDLAGVWLGSGADWIVRAGLSAWRWQLGRWSRGKV